MECKRIDTTLKQSNRNETNAKQKTQKQSKLKKKQTNLKISKEIQIDKNSYM